MKLIPNPVAIVLADFNTASDLQDGEYRLRVVQAIAEARAAGANTVTAICQRCYGAFPTIVADILRVEGELGNVPLNDGERSVLEDETLTGVVEPHPLDFEWRYAPETARAIADYLVRRYRRIACFGTPSVHRQLLKGGHESILMDNNFALLRSWHSTEAQSFARMDLLERNFSEDSYLHGYEKFDVVIMDPPWYVDHILTWVDTATRILRVGGDLILTVFPELVRPTARQELKALMSALKVIGDLEAVPLSVDYQTPLFEAETLNGLALKGLGQWRNAQLLRISCRRDPPLVGMQVEQPVEWDRVTLGSQVIAVRRFTVDSANWGGPVTIVPAAADGSFLFKSVSARDPIRRNATIWTSRNRGAEVVAGASVVLEYLSLLEVGAAPGRVREQFDPAHREGIQQIQALIGW